jgi:hypothetical protein
MQNERSQLENVGKTKACVGRVLNRFRPVFVGRGRGRQRLQGETAAVVILLALMSFDTPADLGHVGREPIPVSHDVRDLELCPASINTVVPNKSQHAQEEKPEDTPSATSDIRFGWRESS